MPTTRLRHGRTTEPPIDRDTLTTLCRTMSDQALGRQFGVTGDTIRWWRRKWDIPNARPCPKGHTLNEAFFSVIDTEEKAYILGFIAADGGITDNQTYGRLSLGVHPRDRDILERILTCLQSDTAIRERTTSQWPRVDVQIYSRRLVQDLRQYGIVPRKSLTLAYPALPKHLERHYIRGLWDGDGHISRHDFCLTGSQGTTTGVQQALQDAIGLLLRIRLNGNVFVLRGSGRDAAALRWLYENATIALQRKQNAYEAFWKQGTVIRHSLAVASKPYQLRLI